MPAWVQRDVRFYYYYYFPLLVGILFVTRRNLLLLRCIVVRGDAPVAFSV